MRLFLHPDILHISFLRWRSFPCTRSKNCRLFCSKPELELRLQLIRIQRLCKSIWLEWLQSITILISLDTYCRYRFSCPNQSQCTTFRVLIEYWPLADRLALDVREIALAFRAENNKLSKYYNDRNINKFL